MVEPRMFIVSSWIVSWPLAVMRTLRSAVFIWGETDVMVPWTIVPVAWLVLNDQYWKTASRRA